jgi:hypothetical protein
MNAAMPQKSSGRQAELNPFDIRVSVQAPKAPRQVTSADRRAARKDKKEAECGCVDWFQYNLQADEDKTTH